MGWDPEKYREKREKVLGVKKRGMSFGSLAVIVSCVILLGAASLSVPGAVSYMQTRHLDDVIFKIENNQAWPNDLVAAVGRTHGVAATSLDTHNTRLVITFDRRHTRPDVFSILFKKHNLDTALLNRVSHRQRVATLKTEKETHGETL